MENKIYIPSQLQYWHNLDLLSELELKATLSGGKGGQNTNKVSTKVELYWTPSTSVRISCQMKDVITAKLAKKLNSDGKLRLVCEEERSQFQNKEKVIDKFYNLLTTCFKVNKPRKATKPSKGAVQQRLSDKKARKMIKNNRGKFDQ